MSDATLRIKNLSIALEALSRINREGSHDLFDTIEALLQDTIRAFRKEKEKETQWPQRPAKPTPNFVNPDDVDEL